MSTLACRYNSKYRGIITCLWQKMFAWKCLILWFNLSSCANKLIFELHAEVSRHGRENGHIDSIVKDSNRVQSIKYAHSTGVSNEGASTSGAASQTASGVLSGSGVLNLRPPGSTTSSGPLAQMFSSMSADVAREYLEKVADLLLEFAQADTVVKSLMASQSLLARIFQMFNKIEPPILLKVKPKTI